MTDSYVCHNRVFGEQKKHNQLKNMLILVATVTLAAGMLLLSGRQAVASHSKFLATGKACKILSTVARRSPVYAKTWLTRGVFTVTLMTPTLMCSCSHAMLAIVAWLEVQDCQTCSSDCLVTICVKTAQQPMQMHD